MKSITLSGWSCTCKEAKMPAKQLEANVRQEPGVAVIDLSSPRT
jgi:hypothetical protein